MKLDKKFMEILCCPICRGDLEEVQDENYLVCRNCRVKYPIKDGIPVLIAEEGVKIEPYDG